MLQSLLQNSIVCPSCFSVHVMFFHAKCLMARLSAHLAGGKCHARRGRSCSIMWQRMNLVGYAVDSLSTRWTVYFRCLLRLTAYTKSRVASIRSRKSQTVRGKSWTIKRRERATSQEKSSLLVNVWIMVSWWSERLTIYVPVRWVRVVTRSSASTRLTHQLDIKSS